MGTDTEEPKLTAGRTRDGVCFTFSFNGYRMTRDRFDQMIAIIKNVQSVSCDHSATPEERPQHTPEAHWRVNPDSPLIIETADGVFFIGAAHDEEAARKMAAAPLLYEALKEMLSHVPHGVDGNDAPAKIPLASQKRALAALAAVEGE